MPNPGNDPFPSEGGVSVEIGKVGNAHYWKYSDGRLECFEVSTSLRTTTNAVSGNGWRSDSLTFTFPIEFIEIPQVCCDAQYNGGVSLVSGATNGFTSTTTVTMRLNSFASGSSGYLSYRAVGRWK